MLTPQEAREQELAYRAQCVQKFRDRLDSLLRRGHRSTMLPTGELRSSEIDSVLNEYRASGWHIKTYHDFFEMVDFSEEPFDAKPSIPMRSWEKCKDFFRGVAGV